MASMKNITHYFSEPRTSEAATMKFSVEVRSERGKEAARKRERVKIKITGANSKSVECKLVENKFDLVDKTPSPLCNGKRLPNNDETPRRQDQSKENCAKIEFVDLDTDSDKDTSKQKNRKVKEKLVEMANKRGSEKRKRKAQDEEDEISEIIQEKKKVFTQTSKKDYSNCENIVVDQRRSSNSLLNYFSKATPEQIQKEKTAMTKLIVKAEIHQVDENQLTPKCYSVPKTIRPKKRSFDTDSILSTADEIEVLSSENISPPPCNGTCEPVVKADSPFAAKGNKTPKVKPKWSMKIKLNSTDDQTKNEDVADISDDEIFTSRSRKKSHKSPKADSKSPESSKIKMKKEKSSQPESDSISKSPKSSNAELLKSKKPELKSTKEGNSVPKQPSPKPATKLAPIFMRKNSSKDIESEVTIVEDSLKRKPTEKLASLFVKRPKPDPEVLAARRKFLQPDFPDPDRSITQKPFFPPPVLFPKISHVTQLKQIVRIEPQLQFKLKAETIYQPSLNFSEMKSLNSLEEKKVTEIEPKILTDEEREVVVKELELRNPSATKIWQRVSKLSQVERKNKEEVKEKRKKRGRPKKSSSLDESVKLEEEDPSKGLVWTSKYKPRCSDDVIGNEKAVRRLKEWLETWKSTEENCNSDSDDDFYRPNSDEVILNGRKSMAVLMGPHGCGKTSSVYAVAEELGYKVIEVNASSKRPGRKVLKDLEEATKSHRIRNHSMESFGFGTKSGLEEKSVPTKTLILLDDIDLVFEEDDGFVGAVYQLASNTKRPMVMTCNNSFTQSSKFAPQIFAIDFNIVPFKKASLFLELVALAETRNRLPTACAESLTLTGDLRKALLQLQVLVASNRTPTISNLLPSLWKETHQKLYRPIIKAAKKNKKSQEKEPESDSKLNRKLLADLASNLDSVSLMANLSQRRDFALEEDEHFEQDSLSLSENMCDYRPMDQLSSEIYDWIERSTLSQNCWEAKDVTSVEGMLQKKKINRAVNMALMPMVINSLDRRAVSVDLLPYVRAICRAEEIRQQSNAKRANRFYHYMQGIVTARPHCFTEACRMFQERSKDKT